MTVVNVKTLGRQDGHRFDFGGLAVHWKIDGAETDGRFSVVHHPIAPRALCAPLVDARTLPQCLGRSRLQHGLTSSAEIS